MDKDKLLFKVVNIKKVVIDGKEIELPIRYYKDSAMMGVFTAATSEITKILPSKRFKPVEIFPSVSLVSLVGLCHHDTSIGPFDELDIGIPVFFDAKFVVPFFSALTYSNNVNFGTYMYRLFVSDEKALIAGIKVWNYPKVIADIKFEDTLSHRVMKVSKDNKQIIKFTVAKNIGIQKEYSTVFNIFSVKDNKILKSPVDWKGQRRVSRFSRCASFEMGESEHCQELNSLSLRNYCVEGVFYPELQYILNPPIAVYDLNNNEA